MGEMQVDKIGASPCIGRRAVVVGAALALSTGALGFFTRHASQQTRSSQTSIVTYPAAVQLTSFDYMLDTLAFRTRNGEHPKLIYGSSELAPDLAGPAHPALLLTNGRYAIDMMTMGRAGTADLWAAIEMGAMAPQVRDRRMVFFVSMQWFLSYRNPGKEFPCVFSEGAYQAFMTNPYISTELKGWITDRMAEYGIDRRSGSSPIRALVEAVDGYAASLSSDLREEAGADPAAAPGAQTTPLRAVTAPLTAEEEAAQPKTVAGDPDWPFIFAAALADARSRSGGNNLGFYDDWYKKKFKTWEKGAKKSWRRQADGEYFSRQELDDFKMLLEVCHEAGITPLVVIQPVKGAAYDQTIYTCDVRRQYYDMIRGAMSEAGVSFADFSDREYDPFFLRDYSHPSDLGGAYYSRAIYSWFTTGKADTSKIS